MPTFLSFYVGQDKANFAKQDPQKWNSDILMECLNEGKYREELVMETEECCKTFFDRHPHLLTQCTPDDLYETLMEELVAIAQKYFHKNNQGRSEFYADAKRLRETLLKKRAELRQFLHASPQLSEDLLAQVQVDLDLLSLIHI